MKNGTPYALARIPLRWMIRECFRCNTGIVFDAVMLQRLGLHVVKGADGLTLADLPERIPGSADLLPKVPKPGILSSIAHVVWDTASWPVKQLGRLVHRTPRLPLSADGQAQCNTYRLAPFDANDPDYRLLTDLDGQYEAEQELQDALSPLYDSVNQQFVWRLLEWLPIRVKKQWAIVEEVDSLEGFVWVYVLAASDPIVTTLTCCV